MVTPSSPTTSVPEDERILDRLQGMLYPYHTGDLDCKCEEGCNFGNRGRVKTALLEFIKSYGNHRELEGRIDEYLNAEQAWLNYVEEDYFNDRQGQLESQKETQDE